MTTFTQALASPRPVLMDGALGTELERRGVPIEANAWSAFAVRDYGHIVTATHRDYLEAGATLHIVNSFALAQHVLAPVGLGDEMATLNRKAVALFDDAVRYSGIDRDRVWAAGSLSTFAANSDRSQLPSGQQLQANFRNQAQALVEGGVELFALEMLFDVEVTRIMIEAVADYGLPVIIGFTCDWQDEPGSDVIVGKGHGTPTMPFLDALSGVLDAQLPSNSILSIMHSESDVTNAALPVLRSAWPGNIAIYPNSGEFIDLQLQFESVASATQFRDQAAEWCQQGVDIIGGCCGIGPGHIAALHAHLNNC